MKEFRALVSQTGENAPDVEVCYNTFNYTPQFIRDAPGEYAIISQGEFGAKTTIYPATTTSILVTASRVDENTITLRTGSQDEVLGGTSIMIIVDD